MGKKEDSTGGCGDRSETGRLSVPISGDLRAVVAYKLVQVLYARRGVPQMEWLDLLEFAGLRRSVM